MESLMNNWSKLAVLGKCHNSRWMRENRFKFGSIKLEMEPPAPDFKFPRCNLILCHEVDLYIMMNWNAETC